MATYVSCATGNFTSATTFALVDSTSYLDSEASPSNISTSNIDTVSFTPGAITVDGVGIKMNSNSGTAGTITITLRNVTGGVDVTSVTLNTSDFRTSGWHFIKFSAPQTLLAATAYLIRAVRSVTTGTFALMRDATTNNFSRFLRTTTTGSPAANDQIHFCGEMTGAGTGNDLTVTYNSTAATSYGATSFLQSITVNNRAIFVSQLTAATAYQLKHKGLFRVYPGATFTIGTSGGPMPSDSTFTLTADCVANVDSGWDFSSGTVTTYGAPLTVTWTKLAADAAASATSLTTTDSTGWKNGHLVCYASTSRTAAQAESQLLTADASGTTLTTAALTNAHDGTNNANGDIRCEVGNLTRNIKFTGNSTSLQGYVLFGTTVAADIKYTEFKNLGSATINKRGIDFTTTTGSIDFQYNSVYNNTVTSSLGINLTATSGNNYTISNNVIYNNHTDGITVAATSQSHTFDNNLVVRCTAGNCINLADAGCNLTNNYVASSATVGINIAEVGTALGTFLGNVSHSNVSSGATVQNLASGTVSNSRFWRNSSSTGGLQINPNSTGQTLITVDNCIMFGNVAYNAAVVNRGFGQILFSNCTFDAGATLTCPVGYGFIIAAGYSDLFFESCSFGAVNQHSTGDFASSGANIGVRAFLRNCLLASSTEVSVPSNLGTLSFVSSQKHDQTAGNHRTWMQNSLNVLDTTIFRTASPSLRITPTSASVKAVSAPTGRGFVCSVNNAAALTPSVWVRKSVVGDGTAYNGNQPRLVVRKNIALGITSDTVLATASGAAGSWEELTATTATVTDDGALEFFVDCDGTQGWINVDDFTVT